MIYLDHNATTPLDERVLEAMLPYFKTFYGNPSSLYRLGRISKDAIHRAREQVASLVGCETQEVIFTSGGTEANNLALKGLAHLSKGTILAGATEHPAVKEPLNELASQGFELKTLPVDSMGILEAFDEKAYPGVSLVSLMLANNETGVIQDIPSIAQRFSQAIFHCDAVQAVGKIPVNFKQLGVNLLSISAHKFYGPKGVGALIADKNLEIKALIQGGGQEHDIRSGTENVAGIVGFGKACELAEAELKQRSDPSLRLKLETELSQMPGVMLFAKEAPRLPNTLQFALAGIDGEMLVMELDKLGFAVSSGSACASHAGEPSPILMAMGVAPGIAKGAIRVSLGKQNNETDIDSLVSALKKIHQTTDSR